MILAAHVSWRENFCGFRFSHETALSYSNGFQGPTHHYVPSTDKLQPRLEDGDVQNVNEVTQVVGQQPVINVVWSLVGEGPADWDEPCIPVPGQRDQ